MKVTNKMGLPAPFVKAVSQKSYDSEGSWRTVTSLIGPAKIAALKEKHEEEIETDASELVYTFQGEVAHSIIEKAAKDMRADGWLSEVRIHKEVLGRDISGAFDLYNPKTETLLDIKNSTVYKAKKDVPEEWTNQTNLLANLIRTKLKDGNGNPCKVSKIQVILIMRDHSKLEAKRDAEYPQLPVITMDVPVWDDKKAEQYLNDRVTLHLKAEQEEVNCTPEERWAKPAIYAIKKVGGARAIPGGLYTDEKIAKEKLSDLGKGYFLEFRPEENVRCDNYCNVSRFCKQYQKR